MASRGDVLHADAGPSRPHSSATLAATHCSAANAPSPLPEVPRGAGHGTVEVLAYRGTGGPHLRP